MVCRTEFGTSEQTIGGVQKPSNHTWNIRYTVVRIVKNWNTKQTHKVRLDVPNIVDKHKRVLGRHVVWSGKQLVRLSSRTVVLSVSVQVVGECQLTVNKLAAFSSVKMFTECVISEVLTAMKLGKWLSCRIWHYLRTQVRKETAASTFRVVHATPGTKVEIFSEMLPVYENTPNINVIPINISSIMIILLLLAYELKQLITCFYDYK
jgi:hypothetical protein